MKAPLNTDNWSGSIRRKAMANTNDWNGFISKEDAKKLSMNCQCIQAPCSCGVIEETTYDNSIKDTVMLPIGKPKLSINDRFTYLTIGLIAVAGYFAYKKFKKQVMSKSGKQLQEGDLELTIRRILKAPLIYLGFMGLSENQARIIYFSLIGVGGYFAYKKFKKQVVKGKLGIDLGNINYDRVLGNFKPRSEDTIRGILMSLGSLSDGKKSEIGRKLSRLNNRDLSNLYAIIQKEENVLQRLNLVYQAMAKADEDRLIKERENRQKNEIGKELSEGFQNRIYPKLQILQKKIDNGEIDMRSWGSFVEVIKAKLQDGKISLQEYEKVFESKLNELLGIKDPNKKNDDLLMYGLIAVVGYLLYKKFKN